MQLSELFYLDDLYEDQIKLHKYIDSNVRLIDIQDLNGLSKILKSKQHNIFVSEFQVFGLEELEVVKLIKDNSPENFVIIFTNRSSDELVSKALLNGADFYLAKNESNYNNFLDILIKFLESKELLLKRYFSSRKVPIKINYVQDPDGKLKYISPEVYALLGYSPQEFISLSPNNYIHPDDLLKVKTDLQDKVLSGIEVNKIFYSIRRKDGQYIRVETTSKSVFDDKKNLTDIYSELKEVTDYINNDVTSLNNSKENQNNHIIFSQSEIKNNVTEDFKLAPSFNYKDQAIVIFDQTTMHHLDVNDEALKLYGYSKAEFLELNLFDVSAETQKNYFQINHFNIDEMVIIPTVYHKNKAGKIFPVEIAATFLIISGRKIVFASIKDLTPHLNLFYSISDNEKKYKQIFENSVDAICVVKEGIHQITNKAYLKLFGFPIKTTLFGVNILDFVAEEEKERIKSFIKNRVANKPTPNNYETIAVKKDGSRFLADVNVSTYKQDNALYSIIIVRDITKQKEADRVLIESESRFRKVFENTLNIPVYGINREHKIIYWNKASEKIFGYTYYEAVGNQVENILYFNLIKDNIYKNFETLFENNIDEFNKEMELIKKNGDHIYVYSNHVLVTNSSDEKEIYSIQTDLSDIKYAENKLRQLSSAVEQNPASILITDISGNIEYVNPRFEQVTGYSFAEVLGKNPRFLKSGEKTFTEYAELWETILSGKEWRGEFHNQKKNGSLFWESTLISPINNEKGEITHFLAIKEDITEKKHQEEELINSEAQFRSVWDSSFDAMRLTNAEGIVLKVNDAYCKLIKKSREQLENFSFAVIYYTDVFEKTVSTYQERFNTNNFKSQFETEMVLWNGDIIWAELSNSFITIKGQQPLLLSIFRDITDRKNQQIELLEAKEKAEEVSRLKSNFLNNMSHEIRTPMVGILGFSQILYSEIESPQLREFVEEIVKSGNRMMNTINSILDLSRIEANKLELKIKPVDLVEEITEVVKPLKAIAEQNDLYLIIRSKTNKIIIPTDKQMLSQIINNLVGNAIKYTRIGGVIIELAIVSKNNSDWVELKVIDSGIGIPEESLTIIFEEFRQVSEGLNRQFEGTGLGLTITKRIVELLKGTIEVKSLVGTGSEFTVNFPLPQSITSTPVIEEKIKLHTDSDFQNFKQQKDISLPQVLLVENDSVNRTVMTLFLNKTCKLDLAENGESSLAMVKNKQYAAILMDINLGTGMNGTEAAQAIRKIPGYEDIAIIAVTAYAMVGDKEKFLASGCTHYISKPFDKETLVNLVKSVMKI